MKQCSKCKKHKNNNSFYKDKRRKSGLHSLCKFCVSKNNVKRKKERSEYNKEWNKNNRDRINKKRRDNADTHSGKFAAYKRNAKRSNKAFNLSKKDFITLTNEKCYYCGECEKDKRLVGIDRVNSNLGYSYKNCVPCCSICNKMKMSLLIEIFMDKINKIYEVHYEKQKT